MKTDARPEGLMDKSRSNRRASLPECLTSAAKERNLADAVANLRRSRDAELEVLRRNCSAKSLQRRFSEGIDDASVDNQHDKKRNDAGVVLDLNEFYSKQRANAVVGRGKEGLAREMLRSYRAIVDSPSGSPTHKKKAHDGKDSIEDVPLEGSIDTSTIDRAALESVFRSKEAATDVAYAHEKMGHLARELGEIDIASDHYREALKVLSGYEISLQAHRESEGRRSSSILFPIHAMELRERLQDNLETLDATTADTHAGGVGAEEQKKSNTVSTIKSDSFFGKQDQKGLDGSGDINLEHPRRALDVLELSLRLEMSESIDNDEEGSFLSQDSDVCTQSNTKETCITEQQHIPLSDTLDDTALGPCSLPDNSSSPSEAAFATSLTTTFSEEKETNPKRTSTRSCKGSAGLNPLLQLKEERAPLQEHGSMGSEDDRLEGNPCSTSSCDRMNAPLRQHEEGATLQAHGLIEKDDDTLEKQSVSTSSCNRIIEKTQAPDELTAYEVSDSLSPPVECKEAKACSMDSTIAADDTGDPKSMSEHTDSPAESSDDAPSIGKLSSNKSLSVAVLQDHALEQEWTLCPAGLTLCSLFSRIAFVRDDSPKRGRNPKMSKSHSMRHWQ